MTYSSAVWQLNSALKLYGIQIYFISIISYVLVWLQVLVFPCAYKTHLLAPGSTVVQSIEQYEFETVGVRKEIGLIASISFNFPKR
jgi:hypothetical protein